MRRTYQPDTPLRNDLYCVESGVKLYSLTHQPDTKSNCDPNPNHHLLYTKLHAIMNIQLNVVACPTYPVIFIQDMLLIHPRHLPVPPTVMFQPCYRNDIQATAVVFYLPSSGRRGRSIRSSLYSRQAGVSGNRCHRLERPASPRRICAVTRGFHTTTQDLSVSRSYQETIIWLVWYYYHNSSLLSAWTPVVLAIINII